MQATSASLSKKVPLNFNQLVYLANEGNYQAMEELLKIFEDEIQYLASFLRIPREDAVQCLKVELLSIVKKL
ncbi:helix-turn-helix domain-containing protein [Niallia sp. Sow4_A1]|uniref:helix-turn-helix domain-containing protein n=1 Tax=Niallia sp. Sow4_A1 TaxID=3438793 RepID=UPI003F98DBB1